LGLNNRQRGNGRGGRQGIGIERALVPDLLMTCGFGSRRVEPIHDVGASSHRTTGQATGHNFGEHTKVGCDGVAPLRSAARPAEACDDLVEDEEGAIPAGELTQPYKEAGWKWHLTPRGARRFDEYGGDVATGLQCPGDAADVVGGEQDRLLEEGYGNAGRHPAIKV